MSPMILALAAAVPSPAAAPAICPNPTAQRIAPDGKAQMQRLDRLPPAETYLAVLHRDHGCTRPILAREYRQIAPRRR